MFPLALHEQACPTSRCGLRRLGYRVIDSLTVYSRSRQAVPAPTYAFPCAPFPLTARSQFRPSHAAMVAQVEYHLKKVVHLFRRVEFPPYSKRKHYACDVPAAREIRRPLQERVAAVLQRAARRMYAMINTRTLRGD